MHEALTKTQLEDAVYRAVLKCLSIPDESAGSRVRLSWPTDGESGDMPGWKRDEDVCFLRVGHFDDPFTRLSEASYGHGLDGQFRESRAYVRGHEMHCIFYGESAMEDAEALRTGIVSAPVRAFLWDDFNIAPFAHIAPPVRADEWFSGAWWPRYDVVIRFYEGAARSMPAAEIDVSPDIQLIGG